MQIYYSLNLVLIFILDFKNRFTTRLIHKNDLNMNSYLRSIFNNNAFEQHP